MSIVPDTAAEAGAIAAAVADGSTTARAVLEEHLGRIDQHESDVHAFNQIMRSEAIDAADAPAATVSPRKLPNSGDSPIEE